MRYRSIKKIVQKSVEVKKSRVKYSKIRSLPSGEIKLNLRMLKGYIGQKLMVKVFICEER